MRHVIFSKYVTKRKQSSLSPQRTGCGSGLYCTVLRETLYAAGVIMEVWTSVCAFFVWHKVAQC